VKASDMVRENEAHCIHVLGLSLGIFRKLARIGRGIFSSQSEEEFINRSYAIPLSILP
jgi:hypothetical protein